jgi:hypothetical protein
VSTTEPASKIDDLIVESTMLVDESFYSFMQRSPLYGLEALTFERDRSLMRTTELLD